MNKTELIQKIKQLEGLTDSERSELIELINTKKKYGLVWEDKPEDAEELLRTQLPLLREVVEKRIMSETGFLGLKDSQDSKKSKPLQPSLFEESENQGNLENQTNQSSDNVAPNHILIEGDNLHALTALTFTHEGKVDVIYIDPPYNTGNKDFKYNDSFVDKEDSFRHSKWLSFMNKRLRIAKRLLSEKGVIFISIDDNEQAQLKVLCDSVFSELNCIGPIIQNKQNAKNDTINVQKNHEYILVYRAKCRYNENRKIIPSLINADFKKKTIFKENGFYFYLNDTITTRGDGGILNARSNLGHTIYYNPISKDKIAVCDYNIELAKISNDLKEVYTIDSDLISKGYVAIRPPKVRGKLGCWTWSKEKVNEEKNDLVISGKEGAYAVKKRTFVDQSDVYEDNGRMYFNSYEESNSRSIVDYSTNDGTDILNEILNVSGIFNNPKNLEMLKYFIGLVPIKSSIILDFFAGSGTTLHATMQLNTEDGGNRQCILVTNNENNICEEVTYERNRRVIQGYTNSKGEWVNGLTNNNLRYYKAEFVPSSKTEANRRRLTQLSTELLQIKEDCYTDITEAEGLDRTRCSIHTNELGKYLIVIYYSRTQIEVTEQLCSWIASRTDLTEKVKIYGFSSETEVLADDFYEVADLISAVPLPDAIYNAYRATFRKLKLDKKSSVQTLQATSQPEEN